MTVVAPASPPDPAYPVSDARRRYTMGLLLLIYTLGFLDRQVVNILAEPIKQELGLSDGQLGALTGLAFALFYTTLGIPVARLADRYDRSRIIAASLTIWSSFTALSGAAGSFAALFAMRVGVGVGEAGCNPPATSLIADIVPRAKRASAMAVYALGNPLGSMIGLAFGGIIAAQFGWRTAFVIAGVPGIAIAMLALFTLKDPRAAASKSDDTPRIGEALREIAGRRAFWFLGLGAAMMAFVSYGKVAFYASFFLRNHASGLEQAGADIAAATGVTLAPLALLGVLLGVLLGGSGALGMVIGGRLADRAARRSAAAYMTAPTIAAVVQMPFFVAALFVDGFWASIGLLCIPALLTTFWFGPLFAVVAGIVRPRVRSTAAAAMQLVINILGLGFGPLTVGLLSGALAGGGGGDGESLRWSLALCSAAGLFAAVFFHAARRHIDREMIS